MIEPTEATRVLLVDDDAESLGAMTFALAPPDYVVEIAPNGAVGLERVLTFRPDVVVFDFWMPVADGRDLVLGIRELHGGQRPRLGLVAISGTPEVEDWGARVGVHAFVRKPFSGGELRTAVGKALEDARTSSMRTARSLTPSSRRLRLDRAVLVVADDAFGGALRETLRRSSPPIQVALVATLADGRRALDSIAMNAIVVCGAAVADPLLVDVIAAASARSVPVILEHAPSAEIAREGCRISLNAGIEGLSAMVQETLAG